MKLSINNHIVGLVHKTILTGIINEIPGIEQARPTNVSDVPRSLQSWVSTIQTVVLTADVFQLFRKSGTPIPNFPTSRAGTYRSPNHSPYVDRIHAVTHMRHLVRVRTSSGFYFKRSATFWTETWRGVSHHYTQRWCKKKNSQIFINARKSQAGFSCRLQGSFKKKSVRRCT